MYPNQWIIQVLVIGGRDFIYITPKRRQYILGIEAVDTANWMIR